MNPRWLPNLQDNGSVVLNSMRRSVHLERWFPDVVEGNRILLVDVVVLVPAGLVLPCQGMGSLRLGRVVGYAFVGLATLMSGALESLRVLDTRGSGGGRGGGRSRGYFKRHLLHLRASLSLMMKGMLLVVLLVGLDALW